MTLYLYAIADAPLDLAGLTGLQDESLRAIGFSKLIVIAGSADGAAAVTRDTLARQDRLVRALHDRSRALLPMRFGATAAGEAALARSIETRARTLAAQLDVVRDREQMTLRITGAAGAAGAAGGPGGTGGAGGTGRTGRAGKAGGSGAAYLKARQRRAVPAEIRPVLEALAPLVRATRVQEGRQPGVIATVYQLIDRGASAAYLQAIPTVPGLHIRTSGPSPAYAFGEVA